VTPQQHQKSSVSTLEIKFANRFSGNEKEKKLNDFLLELFFISGKSKPETRTSNFKHECQ